MTDDLFRDVPGDFVRPQVGVCYGSTTAHYVALPREAIGEARSDDA